MENSEYKKFEDDFVTFDQEDIKELRTRKPGTLF